MGQKKGNTKRWRKFTAFLLSAAIAVPLVPGEAYAAEVGNVAEGILGDSDISVGSVYGETNDQGEVWKDLSPDGIDTVSEIPMGPENACEEERTEIATETALPEENGEYEVRAIISENSAAPSWNYAKVSENGQVVRATRVSDNGSGPVSENVYLTLDVVKIDGKVRAVISANSEDKPISYNDLPEDNELELQYRATYFSKDKGTGQYIEIADGAPQANGKYKVKVEFGEGEDRPYLEVGYGIYDGERNDHEHKWEYVSGDNGEIVAICSSNGICSDNETCSNNGTCYISGNVSLTMKVEKDPDNKNIVSIQATNNGISFNTSDLDIKYQIKYYDREGKEIGTEPPTDNGEYQVRAIFGDSANPPYLEAIYTVDHKHEWVYVASDGADTVSATCTGSVGTCGEREVRLTLDVIKESDYTEIPQDRVSISANSVGGASLSLGGLGILSNLTYYEDIDGGPSDTPLDQEPQDAGTYHVIATFGDGDSAAAIEDTFTIRPAETIPDLTVKMSDHTYRASKVEGPSLSGAIETDSIIYYYYKGNKEEPIGEQSVSSNFDLRGLGAGTYYVSARYIQTGDKNHIYITGKTKFQVKKADRSKKTEVDMKSYDLKGKTPSPRLTEKIEEDAKVTYRYSTKDKTTKGTYWNNKKPTKKGTYYMYAVIGATSNYNGYTTQTKEFTVYADHKWNNMPKKLTSKVQKKKITCARCGDTQTVKLPKKTMSVVMGKSVSINSKGCTFTVDKSVKVNKKYFKVSKNGKITTKANASYYKSMPTSVRVNVKAYDKIYEMTVKLQIPAPTVSIKYEKISHGNASGYRFRFYYNIPGANRIQVSMDNGTDNIKRYLENNIYNPRPKSIPYMDLSDSFLTKLGNKVVFKITAYYGSKNKSKVKTVTKQIPVE